MLDITPERIKNIVKFLVLSLALIGVQGCASPEPKKQKSTSGNNSGNNSDRIMPKEFGEQFSSKKIKQEREAYYAQKRLVLREINPSDKVNQALRNNNIYLMEVPEGRGGSRSIPGLTQSKVMQVNCKTVAVEGMGDVLYGKNHILYRQELLQYMRDFNALMSQYCK